ncbi:MAG TPA: hypothetical protein VFC13_16010 [Actinomycetes bacterium]|nr:hypothetical protein [Actinomycetes bacterium]
MAAAVVAAMLAGVLLGRLSAPAGAPNPALPSRAVAVAVGDSPGITDRAPRWVDGVPLGWPQTRLGVVAAATGYAKVLSKHWFLSDTVRRRRAVAQMAAPEAVAQLGASQDALASALARGAFGAALARPGVTWLLRTSLLGYRVDRYTPTAAEVALWALVVYGTDGGGPLPQALYATSTLRLRWAGGDWKLVAASTVPGPVPLPGPATPTPAAELLRVAGSFTEFGDAPAR